MRWLLAFGGLGVLALALRNTDTARGSFQRIRDGMTYDEVATLIGQGRLKSRANGVTMYEWRMLRDGDSRHALIQVRFRDGRVVDKGRATIRNTSE
ncbi:MAG: hypothetical protein ACRDGH_05235 [Candidatus Limnocylindria bacterium]